MDDRNGKTTAESVKHTPRLQAGKTSTTHECRANDKIARIVHDFEELICDTETITWALGLSCRMHVCLTGKIATSSGRAAREKWRQVRHTTLENIQLRRGQSAAEATPSASVLTLANVSEVGLWQCALVQLTVEIAGDDCEGGAAVRGPKGI
eukprot:6188152-Pleurochrysis_carterae.AAC.1